MCPLSLANCVIYILRHIRLLVKKTSACMYGRRVCFTTSKMTRFSKRVATILPCMRQYTSTS